MNGFLKIRVIVLLTGIQRFQKKSFNFSSDSQLIFVYVYVCVCYGFNIFCYDNYLIKCLKEGWRKSLL